MRRKYDFYRTNEAAYEYDLAMDEQQADIERYRHRQSKVLRPLKEMQNVITGEHVFLPAMAVETEYIGEYRDGNTIYKNLIAVGA